MINEEKTERALSDLQRTGSDHARSIGVLNDTTGSLIQRVTALEQSQRQRELDDVREDERDKATAKWRDTMEADMKAVKADMTEMKTFAYKFGWRVLAVVGTPILLAVLAWIFKGGLAG